MTRYSARRNRVIVCCDSFFLPTIFLTHTICVCQVAVGTDSSLAMLLSLRRLHDHPGTEDETLLPSPLYMKARIHADFDHTYACKRCVCEEVSDGAPVMTTVSTLFGILVRHAFLPRVLLVAF